MDILRDVLYSVGVAAQVLLYWCVINVLDFAPNFIRRPMLSKEYRGEALEKRLQMKIGGGWSMFRALWRMSSINLKPAVSEGGGVPQGKAIVTTVSAERGEEVPPIIDLVHGQTGILVINFGSCS
jgi:hypothetical protein